MPWLCKALPCSIAGTEPAARAEPAQKMGMCLFALRAALRVAALRGCLIARLVAAVRRFVRGVRGLIARILLIHAVSPPSG